MSARRLRICIVYDRLYPASIGGAERWYRLLAERLAAAGHHVTYLTTRHWPDSASPTIAIPGVHIVTTGATGNLYGQDRRRFLPVLRFALGTWAHLIRNGGDYDVVHGSAMAGLTALGAVAIAALRRRRLVLDWWEVWSFAYWRRYAGFFAGTAGWLLQSFLTRTSHAAIAHSRLHASRLRKLAPSRESPTIMRGLLPSLPTSPPLPALPEVVYLGRMIPEKGVAAIVPALALARARLPVLRATLIGDGPAALDVRAAIAGAGLEGAVTMPGFVSEADADHTLANALCLILLSRREGFGLVVAEASARGVPSIVLWHPDSAASELVIDGVNGAICTSTAPAEVASAILRIVDAGHDLRQSTRAWFCAHASELTIDGTLLRLESIYRGDRLDGELPR